MKNRVSEKRTVAAKAKELLKELEQCCQAVDASSWRIGDLVNQLRDDHGLSLKEIKGLINSQLSAQRLSEFAKTSVAFAAEDRKESMSFFAHEMARKTARMPVARKHQWTPNRVLELMAQKNIRGRAVKREIIRQVEKKEEEEARVAMAAAKKTCRQPSGIFGSFFHDKWENVAVRIPDGSLKLVIADPPYGAYTRTTSEGQVYKPKSFSSIRADCDNGTYEEALETTLRLFDLLPPKMAKGGCLALFQDGMAPDDPAIQEHARDRGWQCAYAGMWVKASLPLDVLPSASPDMLHHPFGEICERFLVFCLDGQKLARHVQRGNNANLLFHAPVRAASAIQSGRGKVGEHHIFEKPISLSEELIVRTTDPGDVVFSPFGCTGTDIIAAINTHRRYIGAESNERNHLFGLAKIRKYEGAA